MIHNNKIFYCLASITMEKPWLRNQTTLWLQDNPYSKSDFLSKINKETSQKKDGLYWFSGYISSGIYQTEGYLDIAEKNENGMFSPLWIGHSTHPNKPILEISKRNKDGSLPKTQKEADKLDPSVVIWYQWQTIVISLWQVQFSWRDWFDVIKNIYPILSDHMMKHKDLFDWSDESKVIIKDFVTTLMQQNNYIKAPLGQKTEKALWWWRNRLYDVLGQFFGGKEGNRSNVTHVDS